MAKRERGIFEKLKGSGIWWVRWCDQHGRLHREKVGPKGLARDVYSRRKLEVREGKFFPENLRKKREMLFKDMAKLYLEDHAKPNKRSWRDDHYRSKVLVDVFGNKPLSEITLSDIERWKAKRAQEVSPASVNRYLSLLKTIFNKAVEWEKTTLNPAAKVKLFRENNHVIRFLTEEEETKLKAVMRPEHWPLVEFAVHTGLRRGEQFNLQWENVDLGNRIITIPIPFSKNKEVRYVPINDRVMEILQDLPSRMKSEWVFPSQTNVTPLHGGMWAAKFFNPAVKRTKIAPLHWHCLRHTFASRLIMRGNDLTTVRELMGHKDIKMTLRYSHLSPAHKMTAVQTLVEGKIEGQSDTTTDTRRKRAIRENE